MTTLDLILMIVVSASTIGFFWTMKRNDRLLRDLKDMQYQEDRRQHAEKERREADLVERFHSDVAIIAEAVKPLAHIGELGGMVQGLIEMTKATAAQIDSLNRIAEVLERSISPPETDYRDYAEDTEEGQERMQRSRIRELTAKGISPKEAVDRIREESIYKEMMRGHR